MAKQKKTKTNGNDFSDAVIRIRGARVHNLRDVSIDIPKNKLVCLTGVSGSGKSSLAFDTLYAEGQRRYIESLSSYARQFLGELPKPDVDQISGLAPSISIQQKTSGWNPRSTVGTITQIHDYIRVLFARAGDAHCPNCGNAISAQTREQMLGQILTLKPGTRIMMLAPKIRGQKGAHRDLFDELLRRGFVRARVDGEVHDLSTPPDLHRNRRHDIEVVVDRLTVTQENRGRLAEALELALTEGNETAVVVVMPRREAGGSDGAENSEENATEKHSAEEPRDILLSSGFACTKCDISFESPTPQLFSFNSPQGMCPSCDGLGASLDFDPELLVTEPTKSFLYPCVGALRTKPGRWAKHIYQGVADHVGFDLKKPWHKLSKDAQKALLYGTGDAHITFTWRGRRGEWKHGGTFEGVIADLRGKYKKTNSGMVRDFYEQFMRKGVCAACNGDRLVPQALAITLTGTGDAGKTEKLNIAAATKLSIANALRFFNDIKLAGIGAVIAAEPLKEIRARLQFLLDVGLDYLTLDRAAPTLSGGESQRIRLASQIGSGLVGVLYVLDEPSIGLHPRDNQRLLRSLQALRDAGNTVVVVEHDRDTMEASDFVVDFGPGAGVRGGEIVAAGDIETVEAASDSVTGAYLNGSRTIEGPKKRRPIVRAKTQSPAAKKSAKSRQNRTNA